MNVTFLDKAAAKDYLKKMSSSKARNLSILGRQGAFVMALNTELGSMLLQDLIEKHSVLLAKVGDLQATDAEKMEYKVVQELIATWSQKIDDYYKNLEKIEQDAQR